MLHQCNLSESISVTFWYITSLTDPRIGRSVQISNEKRRRKVTYLFRLTTLIGPWIGLFSTYFSSFFFFIHSKVFFTYTLCLFVPNWHPLTCSSLSPQLHRHIPSPTSLSPQLRRHLRGGIIELLKQALWLSKRPVGDAHSQHVAVVTAKLEFMWVWECSWGLQDKDSFLFLSHKIVAYNDFCCACTGEFWC